jgi:beta-aspartyl-peptidase (threonine type)
LTISSSGRVTRGWVETLAGYRQRYPDRAAMGQLTFSDLEITPLGPSAALVLGRWALTRREPVGGTFSLVFRKLAGRWVIVHDHTSREPG